MTPRKCIDCEGHGVKRNYLDRAGSYEKYHCKTCGGTGDESVDARLLAVRRLAERIVMLEDAISWALGEHGTFAEEPPPLKVAGMTLPVRRRFWWRKELRQRAGM